MSRALSKTERKLRDDGRCVACGAKLSPREIARKFTECMECWRSRNQVIGSGGPRFASGPASTGREFRRRLGYGTGASGGETPEGA